MSTAADRAGTVSVTEPAPSAVTVAAPPYSFSWINVSAGSYGVSAKVVYDSGSTVGSAVANVTVGEAAA